MSEWADWLFLAVGGLLIGSFLYTGWYTTRYEPEARPGYSVIGIGIIVIVTANVWLDFHVNASTWFMGSTFIGYFLAAVGLALVVRARRRRSKR